MSRYGHVKNIGVKSVQGKWNIFERRIKFFNLIPHNGCKSKKAKMER